MHTTVTVGFIRRPHGLKGEVMVEDLTDGVFEPPPGQAVTLTRGDARRETAVEKWAAGPKGVCAKFAGVDDADAAAALRSWEITVARDCLPPRGDDAFYDFELIGLPLEDKTGRRVGEVTGFYHAAGFDVLVARDGDRVFEVPFVRAHVAEVRRGEKVIVLPHREE